MSVKKKGNAVFIFGNKKDSEGNKTEANGCWQEYQIAKQMGCLIIPIGSTGDVAEKILEDIKLDKDLFRYIEDSVDILENEKDVDKIVETVLAIAEKYRIVA